LTSAEHTGNRVHQDAKGRLAPLTAGVTQRQRPLHPALAFVAGAAMRALAPQHAEAQGALGAVVGRVDAMLAQKDPQRRHLALQASAQTPGLILTLMVAINQGAQARLPTPPLAPRGRRRGPLAQALQLLECPRPAGRQGWVALFRQPAGTAHELGPTRLTTAPPILLDAVAIAHHEALPILDPGEQGFLGAMRVHQGQRPRLGGHGPQPLQGVLVRPGRFINGAHRGVGREDGNGLIMGQESLRDPVDHLVESAHAHGKRQDGVAAGLDKTPRVAMHPPSAPLSAVKRGP
jgi:hypothetical protein